MNDRKKFMYWRMMSLLAILALVLTACGGNETPTAPATVEPTEPPVATTAPTEEPAPAVMTVIQDFEASPEVYANEEATTASLGDVAFTGAASLKSESASGEWHNVGVSLGSAVDVTPFTQLCFYVYDTTTNNNGMAANTVGVTLIDSAGAKVQRYTDNEGVGSNPKTRLNEWAPMCMNLITFTGIDQTKVEKIEFTMYWAGTYYFDDVTLVPAGEAIPTPEPSAGGKSYVVTVQNFEAEETYYSDYQADVSLSTEIFHGGASSLKATYDTGEWHAFGAYPNPNPVDLSKFDKLCFWIYDTTTNNNGGADNTVGVKLFDGATNEEIWTDNALAGTNGKTVTNEWVQMCVNLSAFTTVNLAEVGKIQFAMFWAGAYYVDDIQAYGTVEAASEPALAQGFEAEETFYSDYQADVSLSTEIFHGGASSLMATYDTGEWHAFGAFPDTRPFNALPYGKMCFWIYDTTTNNNGGADNTVGVKLFTAGGANEEIWTDHDAAGGNSKTVTNEWVQMCINLSAYTTIDLSAIDKIQFALYWAGAYYIDDITFEP